MAAVNAPTLNDFAPALAPVAQCLIVQESSETTLPRSKHVAYTS